MSTHQIDDVETVNVALMDSDDQTNPIHINSKLERRRRIEDLNEERKLQKELNEFY